MLYLIFTTYNNAFIANCIISNNMRINGSISTTYADPQQRVDGKWSIPKPESRYIERIEQTDEQGNTTVIQQTLSEFVSYTEEEYKEEWFTLVEE